MLAWFCVFILVLAAPAAVAQNAFAAVEDGASRVVKQIRLGRPQVEADGKLRATSTHEFSLLKATVYRPGLVTLTNIRVGTSHLEGSAGGSFNHELRISGYAKSDVTFKNVFLVLELHGWKETGLVFTELHDLNAGALVDLNFTFPLQFPLGEGNYFIHFFADGIELLHTRMPARYLAAQKKKTEELLAGKRISPLSPQPRREPSIPPN